MSEAASEEVHFLITHKIATPEEVLKLNINRKSIFEKCANKMVCAEELMETIKFEMNILKKCKQKIEEENKTNTEGLVTDILNILPNYIHSLYVSMFSFVSVDNITLSQYVHFCSSNGLQSKCSMEINKIMEHIQDDPEIYITVANFEFEECSNINMARRYFAEGIKHHKTQNLYVADFWVELQYLVICSGRSLKTITDKYHYLVKRFNGDIVFHFILLDLSLRMYSIGELQSNIVRDMVQKYKNKEVMWKKLARLHFDGFIYIYDSETLIYETDFFKGIKNCVDIYEKALEKKWHTQSRNRILSYYLDDIMELRHSYRMVNATIRNFLNLTLDHVFEISHENKALLTEQPYFYWADNTGQDKLTILRKAVEVIKNSPPLWVKVLKLCLCKDYFLIAMDYFQEAIHELKDESLPLWDIMIRYVQLAQPDMLERLFIEGSNLPYKMIISEIRPKYLEWYIMNKDIIAGRKLFNYLKNMEPPCKSVYMSMISFEKMQINLKPKRLRKLYDEVCCKFGKDDVEVWSECIEFEYKYCHGTLVREIYKASLERLDESLKSPMKEAFKKLIEEYEDEDISKNMEVIQIED